MNPLDIILWALAVLVVAFALFLVVSIILATVKAIRQASTKRQDATIMRGRRDRS